MEAFCEVKAGNECDEYEDSFSTMKVGIAGTDKGRATATRFAVADGASASYDPAGWARQLTRSFAPGYCDDGCYLQEIEPGEIGLWYQLMQERWRDQYRTFPNSFAQRKFRETPAFATFLGGQLDGLDTAEARWRAVGIGDTVLFHVRNRRLKRHVPELGADDFGISPDGLSSDPAATARMMERTKWWDGDLQVGDHLYVATDALAAWLLRADETWGGEVWELMAEIDGPGAFAWVVADQRSSGAMENDDTTLLRIHLVARAPRGVLVCLPEVATRRDLR